MATTITGDFIGFTYDGIHSTTFGVIRTSNGDRYETSLIPEFEDQSTQIPGKDGSYYFRTTYATKTLNVPIAFDNISESDFRQLNKTFGDKKMHYLIFDEAPYKAYYVKVSSPPTLEYLCFDETTTESGVEVTNRVYKGEGTLEFIAYNPFAILPKDSTTNGYKKYLDNYTDANKSEWAAASGMATTKGNYDKYISGALESGKSGGYINILNPGDLTAPFGLKLDFKQFTEEETTVYKIKQTEISIYDSGTKDYTRILNIGEINRADIESSTTLKSIYIDSKTHLIYGLDEDGNNTGVLLNKYIGLGDFFDLPMCSLTDTVKLSIISETGWASGAGASTDECVITYSYRYF